MALIFGVALVAAVLMPLGANAWFFDDDRDIHVHGEVSCGGFDASLASRYPFARVEGFEIRGRSGVFDKASSTYSVNVPAGWKIEWSVKCSNETGWVDGKSFDIDKTIVGSSYDQNRNVCHNQFPCVPRNVGACVVALVQGVLPTTPTFEDAYDILAQVKTGPGPTDIELCARALAEGLPKLAAPTAPETVPPAPTLPDPGPTLTTIAPVPTTPGDAAPTTTATPAPQGPQPPGQTPVPQPTPPGPTPPVVTTVAPPRTVNGTVNGCNTYGQNCGSNPVFVTIPPTGTTVEQFKAWARVASVDNGSVLTASCWSTGTVVWNYAALHNPPDYGPNPYESDVYFLVSTPSGSGWIPDTYFVRDKTARLGLPRC